ncbi:MAG: exodeoxyribonuclease V subunit gamma, partial [Gammaproteobacteria bacterium]|nr:exodeoxyribonuclease V subunit gamma [Gammaproteobacteria bacterium]
MFALHTSNKAENLLSHLAQVIDLQPLNSPFEKELFLIQSQGMERWLSQQLSSHFGVWGNYEFYFPGNFFTEIGMQFADPSTSANYQREQMVWIFEQLLRELESLDNDDSLPFQILIDYINGENSSVRRFQLAQQLARIFDQYQIMRPDWLKSWSKGELIGLGEAEQWQSLLWQKIESYYGLCHRGEIWERVIGAIEKLSTENLVTKLPQRLSIFGLNTIPPLLLHLLSGLSRHTDIHLYLLTPTKSYWGEGSSRRSMIAQLVDNDEASAVNDHRLLLSMGEQARDFRELLLNQVDFSHEFASYEPNDLDNASALKYLQNALLSNSNHLHDLRHTDSIERDNSVAIHSCHSRLREVEVLHDQMLDILNRDNDLQLRDIVVMSPDIQNYAPHIKVVFGDIPHAIADRTLKDDSEILDNMIQFLKLSRGRFGWQEVVDLLEKPAIFPAFSLAESELELIRHWIGEVNIRWGLSGEHRTEFNLPEFDAFSWQAGLDRLMMGYIIGDCDAPDLKISGIYPYNDIEGNSAQPLGALYR